MSRPALQSPVSSSIIELITTANQAAKQAATTKERNSLYRVKDMAIAIAFETLDETSLDVCYQNYDGQPSVLVTLYGQEMTCCVHTWLPNLAPELGQRIREQIGEPWEFVRRSSKRSHPHSPCHPKTEPCHT